MANRSASGAPENLTAPRYQKGQSGNPGGEPSSRRRLTARFLNALADDFDVYGEEAIEQCRKDNPAAYIKAIAALCPKEVELKRPLEEMTDAELNAGVAALTSFLAAQQVPGGADQAREPEPASMLPTVQ